MSAANGAAETAALAGPEAGASDGRASGRAAGERACREHVADVYAAYGLDFRLESLVDGRPAR